MQTVIQVIATGRGSLRSQITRDPQLEKKFGFIKAWSKQPGRPHGWAKIHSARDLHGAINLEWHGRSNSDLPRSHEARQQTKLNHRRFHRLSSRPSPKPYPRHSHHAPTATKRVSRESEASKSLPY